MEANKQKTYRVFFVGFYYQRHQKPGLQKLVIIWSLKQSSGFKLASAGIYTNNHPGFGQGRLRTRKNSLQANQGLWKTMIKGNPARKETWGTMGHPRNFTTAWNPHDSRQTVSENWYAPAVSYSFFFQMGVFSVVILFLFYHWVFVLEVNGPNNLFSQVARSWDATTGEDVYHPESLVFESAKQ